MKLHVIFLKKKHIYYVLLAVVLVILLLIIFITKKSQQTFSYSYDSNKIIKTDLTGDGKDDTLSIKTDNEKYSLQVNTEYESFILKPDKKINQIGSCYSYWPLKLEVQNISGSKIPEIFTQASDNNAPIQHVFMWSKGRFSDIYCSNNNILGFIDMKNKKLPKFISGSLTSNNIVLTNYVLLNDSLNSFNYNQEKDFVGKNSVFTLIKYITGLPNTKSQDLSSIFEKKSNDDISALFKNMELENNTYSFQNAVFHDTKWDKNNAPTEIQWNVYIKGVSTASPSSIKTYNISLTLKPAEKPSGNYLYKISSISIN